MSSIGSISSAAPRQAPAVVARPVDADGDRDGSTSAAPKATAAAPAPKLATSGSIGRNIDTTA
ncbi:hypothetical protein BH11PSE8_BH11PSE8_27780 [soil metagenome]